MRFWDSSAIVPLLIAESGSDQAQALLREDGAIIVWWSTEVELSSAIRRRQREEQDYSHDVEHSLRLIRELRSGWSEVLPTERTRSVATRLLAVHPLRAADALQLAAALAWRCGLPDGDPFVCLDDRLREAARREGFSVLPG